MLPARNGARDRAERSETAALTYIQVKTATCTCTGCALDAVPLLLGKAWCSRSDSHRHCTGFRPAASAELGYESKTESPHGRAERSETAVLTYFQIKTAICTRTGSGLSGVPLLVGLHGEKWCSRQEFRPQPPRSKRGALYIELREH